MNSNKLLIVVAFVFCGCVSNLTAQEKKPDLKQLLKTFHSEFVLIEPGTKTFSSEYSVIHPASEKEMKVTFTKSFHVAKYEVPQNLWREVMGDNPSRWKGERNSVEMLDFDQAVSFCEKVTELLRKEKLISKKQVVRLPTEIEWEYVASAGTKTKYSFGDNVESLGDYAWFTGNAKGNDPPVGAKKPNPWGLYDIHGYLWEFTISSFDGKMPTVQFDSKSWPPKDAKPILKSGSWKDTAVKLETRYRLKVDKSIKDDAVGLRCLLTK